MERRFSAACCYRAASLLLRQVPEMKPRFRRACVAGGDPANTIYPSWRDRAEPFFHGSVPAETSGTLCSTTALGRNAGNPHRVSKNVDWLDKYLQEKHVSDRRG